MGYIVSCFVPEAPNKNLELSVAAEYFRKVLKQHGMKLRMLKSYYISDGDIATLKMCDFMLVDMETVSATQAFCMGIATASCVPIVGHYAKDKVMADSFVDAVSEYTCSDTALSEILNKINTVGSSYLLYMENKHGFKGT